MATTRTRRTRVPAVYYRAFRGRRRSGHKKMTIPLAVVLGFAPLVVGTLALVPQGASRMAWYATQALTGYDTDTKAWWAPNLRKGALPIAIGFMVHWIAGKLGVNRALGRAGIPFIRI